MIIEPKVFGDDRGFFYESFNRKRFREHTGLDTDFVQDNHSKSGRGVLRGLHYQIEQAQGKLVLGLLLLSLGILFQQRVVQYCFVLEAVQLVVQGKSGLKPVAVKSLVVCFFPLV